MNTDEKLGPLDHVARPPLPWRTATDLTECGKVIARIDPDRIITADGVRRRVARIGQRRAEFSTCMTCWSTMERHAPEPMAVLLRELEGLRYARPPMPAYVYRTAGERSRAVADWERHERLRLELDALVALVDAHRDEFDGYLTGRKEAVDLGAARRSRRRTSGPGRS